MVDLIDSINQLSHDDLSYLYNRINPAEVPKNTQLDQEKSKESAVGSVWRVDG